MSNLRVASGMARCAFAPGGPVRTAPSALTRAHVLGIVERGVLFRAEHGRGYTRSAAQGAANASRNSFTAMAASSTLTNFDAARSP
jgi:hypothetical protein